MSQYVHYTFGNNSSGITNFGGSGAAHNGHARRNQYHVNSFGHPMWGPMTNNADVIEVDGGIVSPYNHTWEIGLRIAQWWPILGVDSSGILCGNDGKLFAIANDLYYGYIHIETDNMNPTGLHYFTIEIAGAGGGDISFYLGTGGSRPVHIPGEVGSEGGRTYWSFRDGNLQLNTDYYFQIAVSLGGGAGGNDYYIGNCAPGCADTMVAGFPCGCYLYSWREWDQAIDLSGGGSWASDVPLWTSTSGGGGGAAGPTTKKCPDGKTVPIDSDCPTPAQDYGGSTPAACTPTANTLYLFVRGTTGNLYLRAWEGSSWSKWYDEGGKIGGATGPGAACWGSNRVDVFVGGGGGAVYHKGGTGGTLGAWENLGGTTTSDCGAASDGSGNVYVFVRGSDGALWHKDFWGGKWHGWYSLGGQLLAGTGPAVCSWASGTLDVYVTGTNHSVYHIRTTGGGKWGGWQNLGGATQATPGCAHVGGGEQAVFVRGNDGALYYRAFGGGAWGNWAKIGGSMLNGTGPGVTNFGNKYHVFVAGNNGNIYHIIGPPWGGWEDLGGMVSGNTTPVTTPKTSTGGAPTTASIHLTFKEATGSSTSAKTNSTLTIVGHAGYVDAKGNFVAGKPYTGKLWAWTSVAGVGHDCGYITPKSDGSFTWSITDTVAQNVKYNVGFVAGEVRIGGTKGKQLTKDIPGHWVTGKSTTSPGTAAHWSGTTSVEVGTPGCEFCEGLRDACNSLASQGFKFMYTESNNYGFSGALPGMVFCDGSKDESPGGGYGGSVASNTQHFVDQIHARCYVPAKGGTTTPGGKTWVPDQPATYAATTGGVLKPSKWANELSVDWTATDTQEPINNDGTVTPVEPDQPVTPEPTTPADVTLTPILPLPPTVAPGIMVVLRDHKKVLNKH